MGTTDGRARVVILAVLLCGASMTGTAAAASEDQVTGSGKVNFGIGFGQAIVNAHGNQNDARGHIKFRIPDTFYFEDAEAAVTCVNVVGNMAVLSGPIVEPDPATGLTFMQVSLTDNGTPGSGSGADLVDAVLLRFDPGCANSFFEEATSPVRQGNFTVKDR